MQITFDPTNPIERKAIKQLFDTVEFYLVDKPTESIKVVAGETVDEKHEGCENEANGVPWNADFHTSTMNRTGKGDWKRKKGASKEEYDDFAAKFSLSAKTQQLAPAVAPPPPTTPGAASPAVASPPPTITPAAAAEAAAAADIDMLGQIDDIFADLDDKGDINDFMGWVETIFEWAKPGAKTLFDLEGDSKAQQMILEHIKTL